VTAEAGVTEASVAEPAAPADGVSARTRLRALMASRVSTDAIAPTVTLRIVLLAFGWFAVVVFQGGILSKASFLGIWNQWDAPHFIDIATWGYGPPSEPARIVLFPAFPYLIRALAWLVDPVTAGMLVSFVASLVAAAGLYRLVRFDSDRVVARGAVIAMSLFPTAYSLVAPYSEALFLAFAVWAFVAGRQDNWRRAGVLSLLAGLTRIQGWFLVPALAVEYWLMRRRIDRDARWVLLGLAAPVIYLGINFVTFADPFQFLVVQDTVFNVTSISPSVAIPTAIQFALRFEPTERWATVFLAPLVALGLLAVVTVWALVSRKSRPSYFVYAGLTLVSFATLSWPISVPRYLMGVFPIFIAAGGLAHRPSIGFPVLVASTLLMGIFMTLFLIGHWAF
jgi:hypothetical protein